MATRRRFFDPNYYYHIYNCGVEKRDIFLSNTDYIRFLDVISYYKFDQKLPFTQFQRLDKEGKFLYANFNPKGWESLRIRLISYCLMPNHFHFLLKPVKENGITQFISDISNSYTRYFNIKNERIGSLLQGTFKSKEISAEPSLLQVSRYIHLNPIVSTKTNPNNSLRKPENYPFSSYKEWIMPKGSNLVDQEEILIWIRPAGGREDYKKFVESEMEKTIEAGIEDLVFE